MSRGDSLDIPDQFLDSDVPYMFPTFLAKPLQTAVTNDAGGAVHHIIDEYMANPRKENDRAVSGTVCH